MAARKPLFMSPEGYSEEMATSDSMTLGGLTMGGNIDMNSAGKIVNSNAATADGDVLVYGQASANLAGLDIDTNPLTMNSQKITGAGAATTDNDVLVYGQSGANLAGLAIDTNPLTMNSQKITGVGSATTSGDALVYGQSSASLAGLSMTGNIAMGDNQITGLALVPSGTTSAVSKDYVDGLVSGLSWKDPVDVLRLVGNATVATINGLGANAGAAYVVTDSGTLTRGSVGVSAGDLVEDDGTDWVLLEAGSGGFVSSTVRAILSGTDTLISPYTDGVDNDKIVSFTGASNTGVDTGDAVDKAACLVQDDGHVGFYDNNGYTYEGTVPTGTWIQFTGTGNIVAGAGLSKVGNTISVNFGDGIVEASDYVAVDLTSGGALTLTGTTPNKTLGVLAGDGITLDATYGVTVDLASNQGLQLTGTTPNKVLGVLANTSQGINVGASGVGITLSATPGLQFNSGLEALLNSLGGIQKDGSGLAIKIDDTPDTLDVDGDGLKVVGLPSSFKINDVATNGTYVTAANIDDLVDGSNADTLHTHKISNLAGNYTFREAVAAGDPVCWGATTANQLDKGDAGNDADSRICGVAVSAVSAGNAGDMLRRGIVTGVLSGATQGTPYYLDAGGGLTTTVPGSGNRIIRIGYAKNSTDLEVIIHDFGKKA